MQPAHEEVLLNDNDYSYWLDAGRPVAIFGIPVPVFLVFLLWLIFPSFPIFWLCIGLLVTYRILGWLGITLTISLQRILHYLRGNQLSGRPWWYRRYFEGGRIR
ncbi:IcmT/TraK family protein [Dryocola clanedunensis]|uniref:IcmT/TraK family protein n=1 Tax=Cedecea sulfonylureivorans TaxID=3051154 RepID=UPI0032AF5818